MNLKDIYTEAGTSDNPQVLAHKLGDWYDVIIQNLDDYDLWQVVEYRGKWLGAFLWRSALKQSYARDRWLAWHACQQAERHRLVIECLVFQPQLHADYTPNYGNYAMKAAIGVLQQQWKNLFDYLPLMADIHIPAGSGFPYYFSENGWIRTTQRNPRVVDSHFITELVPGAKAIITAKHLDETYAGGAESCKDGLLPIQDTLLTSFKDAFIGVYDPRESNSHYKVESILAVTFLALISGCTSINGILKFSRRLSEKQAGLLGFPYNKSKGRYDLPSYKPFYNLLWRVDRMRLAKKFIEWLNLHVNDLPGVLHADGDVVRDTLFAFVQQFRHPPNPKAKRPFELPVGVDPDAPDGLKRDAQGNITD